MSESMRRKSSSRQVLQNLISLTAQRSQEDAEEVERERRRRARELQRGEESLTWSEGPTQHTEDSGDIRSNYLQTDEELKPSCCVVLEEDEGFSDWTHRLENRTEPEPPRDCRVRVQRPPAQQRTPKPGGEKQLEEEEQEEERCEAERSRRSQEASTGKVSSSRKDVRTSYSSTVFVSPDTRLQHAAGQPVDRTSYLVAGTMKPRGGACRVDGEVEQQEQKQRREEEVQAALQREWRSAETRQDFRDEDNQEEEELRFMHEEEEDLHLRREERGGEEEQGDLHLRREPRRREEEDLNLRREERGGEEEQGDLHLRREQRHREEEDLNLRREQRNIKEEQRYLQPKMEQRHRGEEGLHQGREQNHREETQGDLHRRREQRQREEGDLQPRKEQRHREEEQGDLRLRREQRHREEEEEEEEEEKENLHLKREQSHRKEDQGDLCLGWEQRRREEVQGDFQLRKEQRHREEEEEEHRMPDKRSAEGRASEDVDSRSAASVCSSEGEDSMNYGPMSPTFKKLLVQFYPDEVNSKVSNKHTIIERTESLRKSTSSVKKTQPTVPVSKIDKKLEQYTHALEAGEAWNQNASPVSPSKDADGFKVGVADLINQWVRGGEDGSRCSSPCRPADMRAGGVLNKKNLWESIGDTLSPRKDGKENSTGKRYKFVVTGHGKYEKVSVDDDCSEETNCQSAGQFYEDL